MSSTSAYTFEGYRGSAAQLKMKVYILGRVNKPGLYLVPDDTDFLTLLALAGGPTEDANLSKIRIVRPKFIDIDNKANNTDAEIIWINYKKYIETADNQYLATQKIIKQKDEEKVDPKEIPKSESKEEINSESTDESKGGVTEETSYTLRLNAGDTVIINGSIFYHFSKAVDFLSKAAIALSVYNVIVNL